MPHGRRHPRTDWLTRFAPRLEHEAAGTLADRSDTLVFVVALPNLLGLYLMAPLVSASCRLTGRSAAVTEARIPLAQV